MTASGAADDGVGPGPRRLPRTHHESAYNDIWRYPRAKILDVYAEGVAPGEPGSNLFGECVPLIHPLYDGKRTTLGSGYSYPGSVRRRVFAILPDGRVILQHTRTSARDFFRGTDATPKVLP